MRSERSARKKSREMSAIAHIGMFQSLCLILIVTGRHFIPSPPTTTHTHTHYLLMILWGTSLCHFSSTFWSWTLCLRNTERLIGLLWGWRLNSNWTVITSSSVILIFVLCHMFHIKWILWDFIVFSCDKHSWWLEVLSSHSWLMMTPWCFQMQEKFRG